VSLKFNVFFIQRLETFFFTGISVTYILRF